MSVAKNLSVFLCVASILTAVDTTGTWKLNLSKSKYTGMPAPKELTVTYTPQGSGWQYTGKGVAGTGEPISSSFTYVKDGEPITVEGFPYWNGMVLKNASAAKTTATLMRDGKNVGTAIRTVSADSKTMTIRGDVTLPDGKKATFVSVYEKQQ